MKFSRLALALAATGVAIAIVACGASTQEPTATEEMETTAETLATEDTTVEPEATIEETTQAAEGEVIAFLADPDNLQPCMDHEPMRLLETPDPNAPTAAPAPTATLDPRPAPSEDRVLLPENLDEFKLLSVFDRPDRRLSRAICANDIATQKQDGEPYPYGSVLVMISYTAKMKDGSPVLDENGHYIREKLITYHVMRKEEGFGEAYADNRAGEWEFVGYKADGSLDVPPENSHFCAECHSVDANETSDYAFRVDLHDGHEGTDLVVPQVAENEVSIFLYGFHKPELTVAAGTTVTWINNDEAAHSIMGATLDENGKVIPAPDAPFISGLLPSTIIQPGASFSFTFDTVGEYLYLCTVHKNMTGKIIVTE